MSTEQEQEQTKQKQNENDWVRIVTPDKYSFLIKRKVAMASGTLRNMLSTDSRFAEALTDTCEISERGAVVEKLCEYLAYKSLYEGSKEEIPDFTERIPPEVALELLQAADYYEA
ncbi:POZ domain-containing protein [Abortiporus biennis]|nr:POZ domain-containing protein [Abortiporus biennis]